MKKRKCPDCDAAPSALHSPGCDVERCPRCGGQSISCNCIYEVNEIDADTMEEKYPEIYAEGPTAEMEARWEKEWGHRRMPWSGEWPGDAECRELGLWCVGRPGQTPYWQSVPAGTPGATEDLNRLHMDYRWDPETQRFVRKEA